MSSDYGATNVPAGTIKKGFDVYSGINFTGLQKPDYKRSRSNSKCAGDGKSCRGEKIIKDIFTADDKTNVGEHRDLCCEKYIPFHDRSDCGNCEFNGSGDGYDTDAKAGWISGFKVPVGMQLAVSGSGIEARCGNTNMYGWGHGTLYNKNVPFDVATGCAGGWNMGQEKFPETVNDYTFKNVASKDEKSNKCWVGVDPTAHQNNVGCTRAGINKEIFCQMGDYAFSQPVCKDTCKNVKKEGDGTWWCKNSLDRLCAGVPGEPLKRDNNGNLVKVGKQPLFNNDMCKKYCDSAESSTCRDIKTKACSQNGPETWLSDPNVAPYCNIYWKNNPNSIAMSKVCKDVMKDRGSGQSVFSDKGCGYLCRGGVSEVDKVWCRDRKKDYCTHSIDQMLTKDCAEFCEKDPEACESFLSQMCKDLNIKTEDDLKKSVPPTGYDIAHWCGCMMPSTYYREKIEKNFDKLRDFGYDVTVAAGLDREPECSYPLCIEGSIMTDSQRRNKENQRCKQCVQVMLQKFTNSTIIDGNVTGNQDNKCVKITKVEENEGDPLPPGVYRLADTVNYYKVKENGTHCKIQSLVEANRLAQELGVVIETVDKIPLSNAFNGNCEVVNYNTDDLETEPNVKEENTSTESDTNVGAIVGGVVGVAVVAAVVAAAVVIKKNKSK